MNKCSNCLYHESVPFDGNCCMYICYTGHMRNAKADRKKGCSKWEQDDKHKRFVMRAFKRDRTHTKEEAQRIKAEREKARFFDRYNRESNGLKYE